MDRRRQTDRSVIYELPFLATIIVYYSTDKLVNFMILNRGLSCTLKNLSDIFLVKKVKDISGQP